MPIFGRDHLHVDTHHPTPTPWECMGTVPQDVMQVIRAHDKPPSEWWVLPRLDELGAGREPFWISRRDHAWLWAREVDDGEF